MTVLVDKSAWMCQFTCENCDVCCNLTDSYLFYLDLRWKHGNPRLPL